MGPRSGATGVVQGAGVAVGAANWCRGLAASMGSGAGAAVLVQAQRGVAARTFSGGFLRGFLPAGLRPRGNRLDCGAVQAVEPEPTPAGLAAGRQVLHGPGVGSAVLPLGRTAEGWLLTPILARNRGSEQPYPRLEGAFWSGGLLAVAAGWGREAWRVQAP